MQPIITIIVPIYNSSNYLKECLESIKVQTFKAWVCFLINDGSTDDSQNIIDEYCAQDDRFIGFVKYNEKSIDLTRKFGIDRSNTEWLLHIDSDDAIESTYIEKLYKRQLESDADIVIPVMIGCQSGLRGEAYRVPCINFNYEQICSGREACLLTIGGWKIPGQGNLYKKRLLDNVKWGCIANSDELTARNIFLAANTVSFAQALYYYRSNEGTSSKMSARIFGRVLVDIDIEKFVYKNFEDRKDKIMAVLWQRVFNLIYLTADYNIHKEEFSVEERQSINDMLKKSFGTMNFWDIYSVVPFHSLMFLFPYHLFSFFSTMYVKFKRKHSGSFFYK